MKLFERKKKHEGKDAGGQRRGEGRDAEKAKTQGRQGRGEFANSPIRQFAIRNP